MGRIKTLTPVHIGTGKVYYIAYIENDYIYTIDSICDTIGGKNLNNPILFNALQNKNMSRDEFIRAFNFKREMLDPSMSIGMIEKNSYLMPKGNVFEMTKEMDKLIIPGSSLKGYFINVLWYDIIQKNSKIRAFYEEEFKRINNTYSSDFERDKYNRNNDDMIRILKEVYKKITRILNNMEKESKFIQSILIVRDIAFNSSLSYTEAKKYKKDQATLPLGYYETIPMNKEYIGEVIINMYDTSKKYCSDIFNNINRLIDNNPKDNEREKDVKKEVLKEMYNRLINFKDWFPEVNREFVKRILDYELTFVDNTYNNNIDKKTLKNTYTQLNKLNEQKIIMQIGKATNYVVKTYGIAYTDIYKKYFTLIFSPKMVGNKFKLYPGIETMSLEIIDGKGTNPFGFIEIEM